MNYPEDYEELKNLLLSDGDLAVRWWDEFILYKFEKIYERMMYKVHHRIRCRFDKDEIINGERLRFFVKILDNYNPKLGICLPAFACHCHKRSLITIVKHGHQKRHMQKMINIEDFISRVRDTDHEKDGFVERIRVRNEKDINHNEDIIEFIESIQIYLSEQERDVVAALIDIFINSPSEQIKSGTAPLHRVVEMVGLSQKSVDNALQRIRTKLREMGISHSDI
jgi:hypothetical protein